MVALRPPPTRSGQWIRLVMTGLIALHVALSAWMVIQFDGVYTEGYLVYHRRQFRGRQD